MQVNIYNRFTLLTDAKIFFLTTFLFNSNEMRLERLNPRHALDYLDTSKPAGASVLGY